MSDYGLLTGFWRCCRPKVNFYGAYPSGFLLKARRALGVTLTEPILHVCGGRSRDYSKPEFGIAKGTAQRGFGPNDKTLDLDPALEPDWQMDARDPLPCLCFGQGVRQRHAPAPACSWPGILIDRPYTAEDAAHYAPGPDKLPDLGGMLRNAILAVRPGRRVGVLDYLIPTPPPGAELVALYAVMTGFSQRVRCFSVYERTEVTT